MGVQVPPSAPLAKECPMKVTELKNEGLSKSYKIVIPSKTINKAIEERLTEVAATAKIDGFRRYYYFV